MDRSNNSTGSSSSSSRRWTCEACGCNTNSESDRSCTICGTSNGSSLSRRAGYAARSGLFARSVAARRSFMQEELGMEGYELWDRVDDDADMHGDEDEHAIAALAMEVAGVSGRDQSRHRSVIEAARSFAMGREAARPDPTELLRVAYDNASLYQPTWMNPLQIGGRMRTGNNIELGDGECRNVAHLPLGAGEGRALRALEAFPRSAPFASVNLVSHNNPGHDRRPRRSFGFRVAFEHPTKEAGKNMGGYYLIGVTTTSFAAFSERNALQQSPFFWGIEDCGNKYEGSRNPASRDSRRGPSSYAIELAPGEANRNEDDVLFGSREVVTCVVDLESRSLTFWRDDELVGTLITNLPRGGSLYPVVVPYNAGSTVAITGMGGDPLPLLRSFATDWKQALKEKNDQRRQKLQAERTKLIKGRVLTPELTRALKAIFSWYAAEPQHARIVENPQLNLVAASRLWYRCGMKLSVLDSQSEGTQPAETRMISFKDFLKVLESVVHDEEDQWDSEETSTMGSPSFEVGDKVELVEGYERFGDAANGPLHPGERGIVIDLQEGPNGERHSVRVIHNTRRWWYQPQALVREKSGLTESPLVWFLRSILRAHGICHKSLEPFVGTEVTSSSWRVGDAVVPKKTAIPQCADSSVPDDTGMEGIGRVVAESSNSTSSLTARGRESGSVLVEYISTSFAKACGVQLGGSPFVSNASHETRRIPINKLLHTTSLHGVAVAREALEASRADADVPAGGQHNMDLSECKQDGNISEQLLEDLKKMKQLDAPAIENIKKECEKNLTALAGVFEAGLAKSVLGALDTISSEEDQDNVAQALSSLGKLLHLIARTAFPSDKKISDEQKNENPASPRHGASSDNEEEDDDHHDQRRSSEGSLGRLDHAPDSALLQEVGRAGRLSSVQQRRSILLALMSRARRANQASDALTREAHGSGRSASLGNQVAQLDQFRNDAAALLFGDRSDWDDQAGEADEDSSSNDAPTSAPTNSRNSQGQNNASGRPSNRAAERTVLDRVLRGRLPKSRSPSTSGKPSAVPSTILRSVIANGLLGNSLPWIKAASQAQNKKTSSKQKSGAWLKTATDEDGMPLLQLAISLGCEPGIIKHLIHLGAPVTETEAKMAARYDLPDVLRVLLESSVYHNGMIDLERCSKEVMEVIEDVIERQKRQQLVMRQAVHDVLTTVLQKMISLCISIRRYHEGSGPCSRAIADALVGNVMLTALQRRQKDAAVPRDDSGQVRDELQTMAGGRSVGSGLSNAMGLLGIIPTEIFAKSLMDQPCHLTNFLLLIEEYLCSKDINDSAIGLSLLLALLERFPCFGQSPEVERFGFVELLSSHDAFASNRLAEITSTTMLREPNSAANEMSEAEALAHTGVVLCPKQHAAHLHVTLHSSFRCDLCGKGVERGRVMHGCRECDWDACERCTDEAEGGIVKWNHIRELAARCQCLLSQGGRKIEEDGPDRSWDERMISCLEKMDNNSEINNLSIRVLQRDRSSVEALEKVLNTRGELTMHQFISVILPALHASLLGKPSENSESSRLVGSCYRRSKKPRVVGSIPGDTDETIHSSPSEDKGEFARHLFSRHLRSMTPSSHEPDGDDGVDEVSRDDMVEDADKDGKRINSELLRRLQLVLSLYENVPTLPNVHSRVGRGNLKLGELQSLTKPLQLSLTPAAGAKGDKKRVEERSSLILGVEPLTSVEDLSNHVLRTCKITNPLYISFCRRLALDSAILLERPSTCRGSDRRKWRVCRVVSYNESLGYHVVKYATAFREYTNDRIEISAASQEDLQSLLFDEKETNLVLVVREFYVISRDGQRPENRSAFDMDELLTDEIVPACRGEELSTVQKASIGLRVESNVTRSGWGLFTVLSVQTERTDGKKYSLVSDEGEVFTHVSENAIRGLPSEQSDSDDEGAQRRRLEASRERDGRGHISRSFPFLSVRRQASEGGRSQDITSQLKGSGLLKRSWSALSLTEAMRPVELAVPASKIGKTGDGVITSRTYNMNCTIGESTVGLFIDRAVLELPPVMRVRYSEGLTRSPRELHAQPDTTLILFLSQLYRSDKKKLFSDRVHQIFYSVACDRSPPRYHDRFGESRFSLRSAFRADRSAINRAQACRPPHQSHHRSQDVSMIPSEEVAPQPDWGHPSRSRKYTHMSLHAAEDDDVCARDVCDGLDEICIQCMEIIGLLADLSESLIDASSKKEDVESTFANSRLSRKLVDQLDDPLLVAGGLLPDWCFVAPCFAPRVFSYKSRQLLLDRAAFGVSRSTLRQQESKVKDVGRFRQRMASLRARAVELVGEAFSGGAEDPTALQLQADELYGMEEALAAKVKANFRAARWEEHALQVAKAAVNRDALIADAVSIMHQYANDDSVSRRRLEVRFDGESGFDAASGDEAGVTRGFYADVAEALLSCDIVTGASFSSLCKDGSDTLVSSFVGSNSKGLPCKLPLWIPDVDSSNQVIIPTPRADPGSGLGVYPRPLSSRHPQLPFVLEQFRFMGRLFASAMRDGFMLPLPLSTAFLKLVLRVNDETVTGRGWTEQIAVGRTVQTPMDSETMIEEGSLAVSSGMSNRDSVVASGDLPRPGFLGGEVYAAEIHVCRALERLDQMDPPLSQEELESRYRDIATDKSFARVSLGKNYDCSFEEYFQDRTFVDPLDPNQGVGAFPLCANGHAKNVNIHNIREWVTLAKEFILNDGIAAQAMAFRRGVEDFFSADYLRLFTPEELQSDVCGVGDNVDNWTEADVRRLFKLDGGKGAAEALVAVAAIGGEGGAALSRRFGPSSPTIAFVVKALLEATPKMRRQFLSFVTSVPIVTPGQIEVVPMVSPSGEFLPMWDPTCLPRANTCARRLYLPKFETFESFAQVLWAVVSEESKFKGFYEWRGS